MDLEERVKRLEDRAEINDLIVGYFLAADGDDLDGVGDSFTQQATFSSSGIAAAEGRDAIVAFIRASRQHMGLTIHTPHYAHITFEHPDSARGLVGAHLELVLGGETVLGAVRYVDCYRRVGERWLIDTRDMRTIYIAPWNDVSDTFASKTPARWPGGEPAESDYPRKPGTFLA
jgi:hypothetical protein